MLLVWIGVAVVGLAIFLWFFPVTLWFQAMISGVRLSHSACPDALERCFA